MEIIGNTIADNVSVRCGLRIRGGASRNKNNPKHSFRVFFDADYGDSKLENPIFETEGVDEFKKIDFRTAQNYSWSKDGNTGSNTFIRDVLGRDLQGASGEPYTRSRYYHLYLNGIYWGLFMSQERAEANWGESYLSGDDNDFDTLKSGGSSQGYNTEATDGILNGDWQTLWNLARAQENSPTTARYLQMQGLNSSGQIDPNIPKLLDVDNLIDYMLILGYTGAYDNSLAGGGRWNNNNDRINTDNGIGDRNNFNKSNPQFIHMDLADSTAEYRLRFADLAHAALFNDGHLTKEKVLDKFEARRQVVDQVIIAESARWGDAKRTDPADKENWEGAVSNLEDIFDTRTEVFLGHLRLGNLYPDTDAPSFTPWNSYVSAGNTIGISAPEGTIYYTTDGTDPRDPSGSPSSSATTLSGATTTTIFAQNSNWMFDDSGTDHGSSDIVAGSSAYDLNNWKHPDFNESGWSNGPGILGFGQLGSNGNTSPINTPMGQGSASNGSNPLTSYLRKHFNISDVTTIASLTGSLLADDGVIIYINGVEVHRQNIDPGTITATDTASGAVGGDNENDYNSFNMDTSSLINGDNVISVEIHQVNSGSSDLGFDLSLTSTSSQGVIINSPTTLSSRVFNNGEWSALTTQYYTTGVIPQIGDLVISEIHYHPSNPTTAAELAESDDDGDFEFVELANISCKDLELRGSTLAEQVIGTPLDRVVGNYQGNLGNSGEWLQLRNVDEVILASFRYNDKEPWPEDADGTGSSLQLLNLSANVDYTDPSQWGAITLNGSPSIDGPAPFTGLTSDDADGDGTPAIIEYFNGTSDLSAASNFPPILVGEQGNEENIVHYSFIRDPNAMNISWEFQQSSDLVTWGIPSPAPVMIDRVLRTDGLLQETYEFDISGAGAKTFLRQNIESEK